jgi:hypothetical protein
MWDDAAVSLVRALAVCAFVYTALVVAYVSCLRARRTKRWSVLILGVLVGAAVYRVLLFSEISLLNVIWMIAGVMGLLAAATRVSAAGAPPDRHTAGR